MRKISAILILIVLTIVTIYLIQNRSEEHYNHLYKNKINGIVKSISYGSRSEAIVIINDTEFDLFRFDIRKEDGLVKGDSLYKEANSKILELHSKTSNGSYIFTKEFKLK
jgi:hypothetical protein